MAASDAAPAAPATTTSRNLASTSSASKKHRQTRISEHLQTVKRSSTPSSASVKSSLSSSSSLSATAASMTSGGGPRSSSSSSSTPRQSPNARRAAHSATPLASKPSFKLEAVIAAQQRRHAHDTMDLDLDGDNGIDAILSSSPTPAQHRREGPTQYQQHGAASIAGASPLGSPMKNRPAGHSHRSNLSSSRLSAGPVRQQSLQQQQSSAIQLDSAVYNGAQYQTSRTSSPSGLSRPQTGSSTRSGSNQSLTRMSRSFNTASPSSTTTSSSETPSLAQGALHDSYTLGVPFLGGALTNAPQILAVGPASQALHWSGSASAAGFPDRPRWSSVESGTHPDMPISPVSPAGLSGQAHFSAMGVRAAEVAKNASDNNPTLAASQGMSMPSYSATGSHPMRAISSGTTFSTASPRTPLSSSGLVLSVSTDGKACLSQGSAMPLTGKRAANMTMTASLQSAAMTPSASLSTSFGMLRTSSFTPNASYAPASMSRAATMDSRLPALPEHAYTPWYGQVAYRVPAAESAGHESTSHQRRSSAPKDTMSGPTGLLTPPQSVDYGRQDVAGQSLAARAVAAANGNGVAPSASEKKSVPFYPDKERLQSGWKFPLVNKDTNVGLNLSTVAAGVNSGGQSSIVSPPLSAVHSSFPSMNSINGFDPSSQQALSADQSAYQPPQSVEMQVRKSRIQAWLDSPELKENSPSEREWSTLPSRWSDGEEDPDATSGENVTFAPLAGAASGTRSQQQRGSQPMLQPLDLSALRPANPATTMMQRSLSAPLKHQYDNFNEVGGVRVSGKSITPLRLSRKRCLEASDADDEQAARDGQSSPSRRLNAGADKPRSPLKSTAALPTVAPSKKQTRKKGKSSKRSGSVGCICEAGDDGEPMVQCDKCSTWFHLECLELDDETLPSEWFCFRCTGGPLPVAVQRALNKANRRTSVADVQSTERAQDAPCTPARSQELRREPTFSHSSTPRVDYKRHFQDSSLALAPSAILSTPRRLSTEFVRGHAHNQSLSRQYAPVTPRLGYDGSASTVTTGSDSQASLNTSSSASSLLSTPSTQNYFASLFGSTPAQSHGPASAIASAQYLTYSPRSPTVGTVGAAGSHGRKPSFRHMRMASLNTTGQFRWDDFSLPLGSDAPGASAGLKTNAATASNWGLYQGDMLVPSTPPMIPGTLQEDFMSATLGPDEIARQRFLELNSTPARHDDPHRFPTFNWS